MEEQQIILEPEMAVIGGGAVTSVNGYTGDVVLTTSDLENTSDYQTGSEVEGAISIEATAREAADNNLQTQIDGLSASSDVTDIVGTYAELQNYDTSKLGDNDIIKVLQDENQNGETTYYRWSTTTQSFTLIGEEGPYYTKAQADVLLNAKQDTLTAGTNIQISNNTISATDTTYSNFTGTDGVSAGTAGLVPAPATTDAGKFLKADGTWDNAGGGGAAVELTSADNNYHSTGDTDDGIAVWKLDRGYYKVVGPAKVYWTTSYPELFSSGASVLFIIGTVNDKGITGSRQVIRPGARVTGSDKFKGFYIWSVSSNGVSTEYDPATKDGYFLSGENVVSTTGNSNSNVMSQNATTNMVFDDPGTNSKVKIGASSVGTGGVSIGKYAGGSGNYSVTIGSGSSNGYGAWSTGRGSIAIGENARMTGGSGGVVRDYGIAIGANSIVNTGGHCEIALGAYSKATQQGQMDISTLATTNTYGYNNSQYRLLTGLYDGQSAHDAATKGQLDAIAIQNAGAPTTSTVGTVGQLLEDTTNGKLYQCTAIDTTDPQNPSYTWSEVGGSGGGDAFTELTASNNNYPTDNPDGIAVWLLPLGLYKFADGVKVYCSSTTPYTASTSNPQYLGVMMDDVGGVTGNKFIIRFALHVSSAHSRDTMQVYKVYSNGATDGSLDSNYVLKGADLYNGLAQTSGGYALDARQGKVLNDKITALEARIAALEGN